MLFYSGSFIVSLSINRTISPTSAVLNPCVGSTLNSCATISPERVNQGNDFVVSDILHFSLDETSNSGLNYKHQAVYLIDDDLDVFIVAQNKNI